MTTPLREPLPGPRDEPCDTRPDTRSGREPEPGLSARFTTRHRGGPAVTARLEVAPGRTTVLFGPSGGGKTTILRTLAGLLTPDHGRITCAGTTWYDSVGRVLVPTRHRRVGHLFQDYALFPHLTVTGNILYGLRRASRSHRAARLAELTGLLGLTDLLDRRPAQLSGGQAQRVALARALAPEPRLLLLDEPLSALDTPTRTAIRADLRALLRTLAIPTVVVTHERAEAYALGDDLTLVVDGATPQSGTVEHVMDHPVSPAVARALGYENLLPATTIRPGVHRPVGGGCLRVPSPTAPGTGVLLAVRAEHVALGEPGTGDGPFSAPAPDDTAPDDRVPGAVLGTVLDTTPEGPLHRTRLRLPDGTVLTALTPVRDRPPPPPGRFVTAVPDPDRVAVLTAPSR
ncbi:ABC transporter ATP-binding protein [Streptomyces sp. ST2-7A]|uniref:ABC transporter ATP-binding protein n=1 Tax=Streptomyces sp. ST2-7A TaxID=2907214 RepID=UPI001F16DCA8|nr:ABC transporter ATP-binding protein [Streptomyces sp. ST2-7A]MCE7080420.1 ABC transporter ATP-binding protein [Streptomyces sp. ST2-7A]